MTMSLTPDQLRELADALLDLDKVGVDVKMIQKYDHDVYLAKVQGQHIVVGITNKQRDPRPEGTLR